MHDKRASIKKFFFAFAAVLAFAAYLQIVAAANPVIFDGTVLAGYKYKASTGEEFSVSFVAAEHKLIIDFPGETLIVENQTCSTGKRLEGCFDVATFKGYNYSLPGREVYEFKIKISVLAPDIKIMKYVETAEVEVGEQTTVRVNVTNQGSAAATVYFTEKVPSELKISELELPGQTCQLSTNNTLLLIAEIDVGQVKLCDYKVTPASPGSYALVSAAEYDSLKRERTETSLSLKAKELPLAITATYNAQQLLGQKFNITVLLKSDKKVDSFVFNAFIPGQIRATAATPVQRGLDVKAEKQKDGFKATYGDKSTSLNGSIEILISAEAVTVGEFIVAANASWSLEGLKQKTEKGFPVNVTLSEPYFRLNKYDSGTGKAFVDVINPAHLPIYNVSIASDDFAAENNQPLTADAISSLSHASIEVALTALTAAAQTQNYTGLISYHTQYGQRIATPAEFQVNASLPLQKTETPANETPPASEQQTNESAAQAQQPQPQQVQKQKKAVGLSQVKVAAIMVAAIIVLIIAFLTIKSRGEGKGELGEETEAEAGRTEENRPTF